MIMGVYSRIMALGSTANVFLNAHYVIYKVVALVVAKMHFSFGWLNYCSLRAKAVAL